METTMSREALGWAWVGGQVVLLGALILLPGRDDWPVSSGLGLLASILFFAGLVLVAISALGLGRALTPTPVPTGHGELTTTGLYAFMRHPIYTGVLTVVGGITLRSGSWIHLAIAVATFVFFDRKAAWEEKRLAETYPTYPQYAAVTSKFVPRPPKPRA